MKIACGKDLTERIIQQLTPIERYALHYLEYLHVSDDETAQKVTIHKWLFPFVMVQMY